MARPQSPARRRRAGASYDAIIAPIEAVIPEAQYGWRQEAPAAWAERVYPSFERFTRGLMLLNTSCALKVLGGTVSPFLGATPGS